MLLKLTVSRKPLNNSPLSLLTCFWSQSCASHFKWLNLSKQTSYVDLNFSWHYLNYLAHDQNFGNYDGNKGLLSFSRLRHFRHVIQVKIKRVKLCRYAVQCLVKSFLATNWNKSELLSFLARFNGFYIVLFLSNFWGVEGL